MNTEFIVPSGRIIKEYLDEYGINQKELSTRIGMSEKHISNFLNGKTRLTEDFALKLEKVLVGIPASYWLNYETKYREKLAREKEKYHISKYDLVSIAKKFKFKEVFAGLSLSLTEQAIEMLKLLKISDFSNFDSVYSNLLAYNFMEDGGEKESIVVWLKLCESEIEIQNNVLDDIKYKKKELKSNLNKFKLIANNSNLDSSINSCRKLCNRLGIYLVFCESITNSKVRGALTTYKDHPAIYLSNRFKRHDYIWFAFIHEIAHLLLHYTKNETIISFDDLDDATNDKEQEANEFARDFFINPEDYREFIKQNEFTKEKIVQFAIKQNVQPGIAVARLQHDGHIGYDKFSYLR